MSDKKRPTEEEDERQLAELARDCLHIIRCPHCKYLTVHGYMCMKCGEDTGR